MSMDPLFEDDSMDALAPELDGSSFQHIQPLMETCLIDGETVVLPSQVCEDAAILNEMLSPDLLGQVLTKEDVHHLQTYLPDFGPGSERERQRTWEMLFTGENFAFGNPAENFAWKMESGLFNPDIAQTRKLFLELQRRNVKREQRSYYFNLLQNILVSRQQLLEAASQLPPGQAPKSLLPSNVNRSTPSSCKANTAQSLSNDERVRKRYFEELKSLDCISSEEDVNYPEGPPAPLSKKQRRHLSSIQGSLSCDIRPVQSTLTQQVYNRPILQLDRNRAVTIPLIPADEEVANKSKSLMDNELIGASSKLATEVTQSSKKITPGDSKRTTSAPPEEFKPVIDVLSRVSGSRNPYEINEETYKAMLHRHRLQRSRLGDELQPETGDSVSGNLQTTLEAIAQRVRLCSLNRRPPPPPRICELPRKNVKVAISASSSSDEAESDLEPRKKARVKKMRTTPSRPLKNKVLKPRPPDHGLDATSLTIESVVAEPTNSKDLNEPRTVSAPHPLLVEVKKERVEVPTIPMVAKPPPPPPPPPLPPPPPPSLTQDTHSSFFHLLRQVLLCNSSQMLKEVTDALILWNNSPISPLNEWYSQLMTAHQRVSGWTSLVSSALEFLADHNLVSSMVIPEPGQQQSLTTAFTWINQPGKDSDLLLQDLSSIWLQQQQQQHVLDTSLDGSSCKLDVDGTHSELNDSMLSSPPDTSLTLGAGLADLGEDLSDVGCSALFDTSDVVHPPRSVTSWTVRPSTNEEKATYQEQERIRYCQPHKAFTFRQHGYESIVGPVKGVYVPGQGMAPATSKVRGHNLMVPDRPACVTLLSLVRDAAARLPNGEGTRAEICELMKESQYLSIGAEASIQSVVSGALDRLHYEADPCVKYDSTRKVWIYLHRHRTESEFEQLHLQHQGLPSRVKKPRSESRRSSGVTGSPGSAKSGGKTTSTTPSITPTILSTALASTSVLPTLPVAASCSAANTVVPATTVTAVPPPAPTVPVPPPAVEVKPVPPPPPPAPVAPPVVAPIPPKNVPKMNPSIVVTVRQEIRSTVGPGVVTSPSVTFTTAPTTINTSSSSVNPTCTIISTPTSHVNSNSGPNTIQTFQITTASGVQTIRVAAPANLPTALLARTLQISAQQQSVLQSQKAGNNPSGTALLNGNSSIKQVILSPPPVRTPTLLSHPRQVVPVVTTTMGTTLTSVPGPPSSTSSIIRLNIPSSTTSTANIPTNLMPAGNMIRARLPANAIRLAGRPGTIMTAATTATSSASSTVQTYLIRPQVPSTTTTVTTTLSGASTTNAPPRLVMVNNKLINLSATPIAGVQPSNSRPMQIRAPIPVTMAAVRKAVPINTTTVGTTVARPMLARVVQTGTTSSGGQQQVISLESLLAQHPGLLSLSSTGQLQKIGPGGAKTGVVQLPLSALTGLNMANATSSTGSGGQPTTVLLQNVKGGAQSILLPAGFQGGTINIRGVRLATVSHQQQPNAVAGSALQPQSTVKPAIVARLVAPPPSQQQQPAPPPKSSDLL